MEIATEKNSTIFSKEIQFGKPLNDKLKEHFYSEFASLAESGIDMRRSLQLIVEEQEKKRIEDILVGLLDDIILGMSLSQAMKKSGHFSSYEYQSIRIGEETGRLRKVLISLSGFFGDKVRLRRQLVSVFTYPVFVLTITLGVLYFMLNYVVPMFQDVFKQFGQTLPWLTMKIVWLSEHFGNFVLYFFILSVSSGVYFYTQRKEVWFRKRSSSFVLGVPIFGSLIQKIYLVRFCQSMGLLLEAKTPLVKSLDLVSEMIQFYPMEEMIFHSKNEILAGNQLHTGMGKHKIIDRRIVSLVKIAEEINQLDQTFVRLAKQYNDEIDYRTKLIGTIIEPAIIVIIGLVVGLIMVAMYLPMFNLSNVIK